MAGNSNFGRAKDARQDEFYTQLSDIENELRHYKTHFRGKCVPCNCDDPFESNFFKYFALNFNRLGLRKLIATSYAGSPISGTLFSLPGFDDPARSRTPYKAVVTSVRDATGDGATTMEDVAELFRAGENELTELDGDGDFRSQECLDLLEEADVVATNPPFSLFREYVIQLVNKGKGFVVIGPQSGVTYKEVFPLVRDGKVWLGYNSGDMAFMVPDYFEPRATRYWQDETGQKWRSMGNIAWFTNLDIRKRHEELILVKRYSSDRYHSYVNFDGIDVPKVADLPFDYKGNMGVPLSFLGQYNPDQFQIVGFGEGNLAKQIGVTRNHRGRTDVEIEDNGQFKRPFARIVIRNRHPEEPLL